MKQGIIATGKVSDQNDKSFFVQVDGQTYELPKIELTQEQSPKLGDEVQGFVYENLKHKARMTQFLPAAGIDQYGWGTVTDIRGDLGVFVDIGLPDKDVVVSMDDLPFDKSRWPKKGDQLMVRLETDQKERLWAKLADSNVFEQLSVRFPNNLTNREIFGTIYASREVGYFLITKEYYLAFIHSSQADHNLRLGEQVTARVIGTSKYGRLNLSVLPRAFEEIDDDAGMILMSLKREASYSLPFSDKSDAQEIVNHFGISKSAFKRALGHLLKQQLITMDKQAGTITLTEQGQKYDDEF